MRVVFFGTPADAVPALHALHGAHDVAFVVTQPDRRRGRGPELSSSPVASAARALALDVRTPDRAGAIVDDVRESGSDVGVVVAFGQLLPPSLLEALPGGFVNVHFSLLPRWRGAAPVERAILAGDTETGVCVMQLDAGLDTGPVFACRAVPIGDRDTAGELRARLADVGAELLLDTLPRVFDATPSPQRGDVTMAPKLDVDEFALDWQRPAGELDRVVRAGNPRPGAFTRADGVRLKVLRSEPTTTRPDGLPGAVDPRAVVATGVGGLQLLEVQPEGRRSMSGAAWLAGRRGEAIVLGH